MRRREEIAAVYDAHLASVSWLTLPERPPARGARFYYWIQMPIEHRDRLATHLLQRGVYTNFRYWPLHRTQMYGGGGVFSGADMAAESTLLLPVHQGLSDAEVDRVIDAIQAFPGSMP